jgi:hypothetical protein
MSGIGSDFGITKETPRQQVPATSRIGATLRALAAGLELLMGHDSAPGRVPTPPPRFESEMMGNFIAFKMKGIKDSPIHTSDYKRSVYRLFFGDEFSPIKPVAMNHAPIAKDVLPWQPNMGALYFANTYMAEAAGYGIDGQVFCATACMMEPHSSLGEFVSRCMTQACGSSRAVKSVHRDQVKANVQLILAKVKSGKELLKFGGYEFLLEKGLAHSFGRLAESIDEASSLASSCLMYEVAIHHLRQLGNSDELGDLVLTARLVSCLLSQKISKYTLMGHLDSDDIIEKLGKHAEGALEDSVFDQCAEVATSLLSLAPEAAQALLDRIPELRTANAAMAKLNAAMDWFKDQGLTTIGGVENRGSFAFGPYPGKSGSFDIKLHGPKAVELATAWLLNPYGDVARAKAILDYVKDKAQYLAPEDMKPLHEAYETMKAELDASPVPEVKARAELL